MKLSSLPDNIQAANAMYAPLDGMNEKDLAVSVNMIQNSATISQNTSTLDREHCSANRRGNSIFCNIRVSSSRKIRSTDLTMLISE